MSLGMKSARRRHEAERVLKKIERYIRTWGYPFYTDDLPSTARHYLSTRHPCSCHMCGHARVVSGPNVRELRERARVEAEMAEVVLETKANGNEADDCCKQ